MPDRCSVRSIGAARACFTVRSALDFDYVRF
jgi:hypothetical protein